MQKLGNILLDSGLLTEEQVKTAIELQKMTHKKLGDTIIGMGILSDIEIVRALEKQCGMPYVDLTDVVPDIEALSLMSEDEARKYCAIPIGFANGSLVVVINDPLDVILVDEISYLTKREISTKLGTKRQILEAIDASYGKDAHKPPISDLVRKQRPIRLAETPEPVPVVDLKAAPAPAPAVEFKAPVPATKPAVEFKATVPPPKPAVEFKAPVPPPSHGRIREAVNAPPEPVTEPVAVSSPVSVVETKTPMPEPAHEPEHEPAPVPPPVPIVEANEPEPALEPEPEPRSIEQASVDRFASTGGRMLDFTQSTKQFLTVNMIDHQTIRVRMPTKRVFAALSELQNQLANLMDLNARTATQLDDIYNLTAVILSSNLDQKDVKSDYLSDLLDIEDVRILADAYMDFVNRVLNGKEA